MSKDVPVFENVGQQEPAEIPVRPASFPPEEGGPPRRPEAIEQFRPYLIHLAEEVVWPQIRMAAGELSGGAPLEALMLRGVARILEARADEVGPRGD